MVHFSRGKPRWFDLPTCALMGATKQSVFKIQDILNIPLNFNSYSHAVVYPINRLGITKPFDSTLVHSKHVDVF